MSSMSEEERKLEIQAHIDSAKENIYGLFTKAKAVASVVAEKGAMMASEYGFDADDIAVSAKSMANEEDRVLIMERLEEFMTDVSAVTSAVAEKGAAVADSIAETAEEIADRVELETKISKNEQWCQMRARNGKDVSEYCLPSDPTDTSSDLVWIDASDARSALRSRQYKNQLKEVAMSAVAAGAGALVAAKASTIALGFGSQGIAGGSLAAAAMSKAAVANGGTTAAGSVIATLQSFGAASVAKTVLFPAMVGMVGFKVLSYLLDDSDDHQD